MAQGDKELQELIQGTFEAVLEKEINDAFNHFPPYWTGFRIMTGLDIQPAALGIMLFCIAQVAFFSSPDLEDKLLDNMIEDIRANYKIVLEHKRKRANHAKED